MERQMVPCQLIEHIRLKNCDGDIQQCGVAFDLLAVDLIIAGVHHQKHQLKGHIAVALQLLHQFSHQHAVLAWKRYNDLEFIQCACRFTENCTTCDNGGGGSKRQEVKVLLRRLKRDNPNIENSIFRSIHGVALDTMPGYKTEGQEHSFLERFDRVEAELQKELKEKQKQEADKTE